jgi:hypothetical protein
VRGFWARLCGLSDAKKWRLARAGVWAVNFVGYGIWISLDAPPVWVTFAFVFVYTYFADALEMRAR